MGGPVAEPEIERMEGFFRDRSTATQVEVSSLADASLLSDLSRRGYAIAEQTHTLVCPLESGTEDFPTAGPMAPRADVEIAKVQVKYSASQLRPLRSTAPFDGVVSKCDAHAGGGGRREHFPTSRATATPRAA